MPKDINIAETSELLKSKNKIVLCSHISPDGDTLGSMLALGNALTSLGKEVILTVDDTIRDTYAFLPGIEKVIHLKDGDAIEADLLVAIDISSIDRIGNVLSYVKAKETLNIDHHLSNTKFADYIALNSCAAATGELVYDIVVALNVPINSEIAVCLYTALFTDTGSFKYSNTTPRTLEIASQLLAKGVRPDYISDCIGMKSKETVKLLTEVLATLTFACDNKIAYIQIDNEHYDETIDTDAFISYPRYIKGVEVAIMFKEIEKNLTRVSMRSSDIDVSEIALSFGGGGHMRAAGCSIYKHLDEAKKDLLEALKGKL